MKPKKSEFIGFRTDPELKKQLEWIAEENEIPLSMLITKILKEVIRNDETSSCINRTISICNTIQSDTKG